MALYKGFSTYNRQKKFRVADFDLVKQDLLNHFNIRKGEKLMNPEFGTIIWNMIFEQFTEDIKNAIVDDVKRIAAYDPRISVSNVFITEYEHGLQIELMLTYIQSNTAGVMKLQFSKDNKSVKMI